MGIQCRRKTEPLRNESVAPLKSVSGSKSVTEPQREIPVFAETDVLVIGGGIAGCHAAISAAKHGAKVAVMDRGHAKRSGMGGAGVDHWHGACTNPCSKVTPEEYTQASLD